MAERLQKFLARSGIGSRRYCEELIKSEKVYVNGLIAQIGSSVKKDDIVEYEGKIISSIESEIKLLILNKPEGVLSSNKRDKDIPIVFDFLPKTKPKTRWISIGRLDINSSGLMLFTNDGNFANLCMHPSSTIDREYLVRARGEFNEEKKQKMLSGINIDGVIHQLSDIVEGEKNSSNQWFSVCLMSGKNKEVRKIFSAMNLEISRLKRTRFGPIFLPSSLKRGKCIDLSNREIDSLKSYGT
ncbi:MAG: pseudouridylate synthase [Gammaproteobacteria bacterium TMED226]|nr:MAG: pseudouridylate synthase [Gammaproteobacteria bacterium TMED226]|tara:strand:+ start:259 stop:984 length:726 start_codon:yes stop_codon:yes gene_type:complete